MTQEQTQVTNTPLYAHKVNGRWTIVTRPDWYYEDKTPVSDETLAENGYYLFINEGVPEHNSLTHEVHAVPKEQWEVINDTVTQEYILTPRSLDDVKREAIRRINENFESMSSAIADDYPVTEQSTWSVQQAEVRAWREDPTAPTPLLERIALARGIPLDDLRQLAAAQVDQFVYLVGHTVGERQKFRDRVYNATTAEEIVTIVESSFFTIPFEAEPEDEDQ